MTASIVTKLSLTQWFKLKNYVMSQTSPQWAHRAFLQTYQNILHVTVIFSSISAPITNSSAYTGSALNPAQCKSLEGRYFWDCLISTFNLAKDFSITIIEQDSKPVMAQSFLGCDEIGQSIYCRSISIPDVNGQFLL